jgi:hypothetical protein
VIDQQLKTHLWTGYEPREIKIAGKSIFHQRCRQCGRDFAREANQTDWKAVYVGVFALKFLEDLVTQQWVSDPCPGSSESSPSEVYRTGHAVDENPHRLRSFNVKPVMESDIMPAAPRLSTKSSNSSPHLGLRLAPRP